MTDFLAAHWLDIVTTLLGLAYILLEYKASLWLWAVGFVMQAMDIVLYYQHGLYADAGMEFYYIAMTVYGFANWKFFSRRRSASAVSSESDASSGSAVSSASAASSASDAPSASAPDPEPQDRPVTHFERRYILPWTVFTLVAWGVLWYWLEFYTDSRVPVADAFTTALSFVGIWALARKYLEQWLIWIAVDVVTFVLYFYKGIPFKASLYALYVIIAVAGYLRWRRLCR